MYKNYKWLTLKLKIVLNQSNLLYNVQWKPNYDLQDSLKFLSDEIMKTIFYDRMFAFDKQWIPTTKFTYINAKNKSLRNVFFFFLNCLSFTMFE